MLYRCAFAGALLFSGVVSCGGRTLDEASGVLADDPDVPSLAVGSGGADGGQNGLGGMTSSDTGGLPSGAGGGQNGLGGMISSGTGGKPSGGGGFPGRSPCPPGEYSQTGLTPCDVCPSGAFAAAEGSTDCVVWTDCEPGQYVSSPGSAVADRGCLTCEEGSYSGDANSESCTPTGCPEGQRALNEGGGTVPSSCELCESGSYCSGLVGDEPHPCGEGTWDHDADPSTRCEPWTQCGDDEFVDELGSALTDVVCMDCPAGLGSNGPNASECYEFLDITAAMGHTCLHYGGTREVRCFGDDLASQPPVGVAFSRIDSDNSYGCGIRADNKNLVCWGENYRNAHVPPSGEFKKIFLGYSQACALRMNDTLTCWGGYAYAYPRLSGIELLDVGVGNTRICGIRKDDGSLVCDSAAAQQRQTTAGPFTDVTSVQTATCAVAAETGFLECWGVAGPAGVAIRQLADNTYHMCGLKAADDTAECWGGNWGTNAPNVTLRELACGWGYCCGLRSDNGQPICWGSAYTDPDASRVDTWNY